MMDVLVILFILVILFGIKFTKDNEEYLSLKTCNSIRGILALIVLFHHIAQRIDSGFLFFEFANLGFLPVSVFFFFSGYGLMKKHISEENYSKGFIKKRIPSLLIPYVIVIFLYWLMYACYGDVYSIGDMIEILSRGYIIASASWYIVDIIILYFVFYLSMKLFKKNNWLIILSNVLFNILLMVLFKNIGWGEYWYNTILISNLGMFWAFKEENIIKFINKSYYLVLPMIVLLFGVLWTNRSLIVKLLNFDFSSVLVTTIIGILFTLIVLFISRKFIIGNKILDFVGKISLEVYLLQGIFVYIFIKSGRMISSDIVTSLIVIALTIGFGYVFNKLFSFILSKYKKLIAR